MATDSPSNSSGLDLSSSASNKEIKLYSIVLSTTMLVLSILFGGGGCITVLIAIFFRRLHRKLRYILIGILLVVCSAFDFIWCPIEIARLLLHQRNALSGNEISIQTVSSLNYTSSAMYVLLLCALATIIVMICIQNLLKVVRKYDAIPKVKLGIILLLIWLITCIALTVTYVLITMDEKLQSESLSSSKAFHFKLGVQIVWFILMILLVSIMLAIHLHTKVWRERMVTEISNLHSNENFTVPSLIVKSVEEIDEEDIEESSVALPSPDIVKDSPGNGSPTSRCSKSALKKRSASPSSQKVLFADTPSPTRDAPSPKFGERLKKSQNHLDVNMAAILGRRRHTIAQITDPQLDHLQKAKNYNYVRKFSVDISALQAQLENPKIHNSFPFHSQQDIKNTDKESTERPISFGSQQKCNRRSRDEMLTSQEIKEEPENEFDHNEEETGQNPRRPENFPEPSVPSVPSPCASVRSMLSARDSICPTPPMISLTPINGEEKHIDINSVEENDIEDSNLSSQYAAERLHKPCKLSCLLVLTFVLSILPMFITEILWDLCLSNAAYLNTATCMTAISMAQTMIFPQVIFCVDASINKAVHISFVTARLFILGLVHKKEHVPTNDISDTEV
ncbi:uncharacterized protein LOC127876086 [Dreissena polymorpha]|uniref:Uncharacterized protein n=1 Tax=Dreissena polymorpha TaxID=45954 RepID=A0A9D4K7Z2_DREPO|nr:uncharacterized protein LOC127876086 [Dreissena polymorpha]KAH3834678.1 hypothetical protein DPMN_108011 [Dreissena polymorpha]